MNCCRFFWVLVIFHGGIARAQSVQDVFTQSAMTWYGLDFSQATFIGSFDLITQENASQLRDIYFRAWNAVVINEKEKYDLAKYFSKPSVTVDLSPVQTINDQANTNQLLQSGDPEPFRKEKLEEMVSKYETQDKSGLGLVFVVESYNKPAALGTMDVVFFDIASRKILLAKRMHGKAGGFGLRNYWSKPVYEVMKQCKDNWKSWQQQAAAN